MSGKARILIAHTGGTIGMKKTAQGYKPLPGCLPELLARNPHFRSPDLPAYEIEEFEPLLDSSNMTPADWVRIARAIQRHYEEYDGFLVLHGTDTMAFTASALSFMLEGLAKPVLVTGAQIPLEETRNDAQDNLLASLVILARYHDRLPGVFIYFANQLLRGNRATKVDTDSFAAFASPNFPPVGKVGINIEIDWDLVLPPPAGADGLAVVEMGEATIAAFRLFPGLKAEYLQNILGPPVQGVVLECYGSGNAPNGDERFLEALRDAAARGVVIVDVPQPLRGRADLEIYATGRVLLDVGVVGGCDMTAEAALTKLFYLFKKGYSPAEARRLVQENLRGELTPRDEARLMTERLRRER